jgi:hypothetical protein
MSKPYDSTDEYDFFLWLSAATTYSPPVKLIFSAIGSHRQFPFTETCQSYHSSTVVQSPVPRSSELKRADD